MTNITYRQLNENDAEVYQKIRLEMLKETPAAYGESYEENKEYKLDFFKNRILSSFIIGAFDKGKIIGTAGYFLFDKLKTKHKACLWGVYVKTNYRGQSISYCMSEKVIELLPDDVNLIHVMVTENNIPAIKTYEKLGFKKWGLEEKALKIDNEFYNEIHMVKFLNKEC